MKKAGAVIIAVVLLLSSIPLFVSAQECFLPCTVTEECNVDQTCTEGCCVANNCQVPCTSNAECSLDHTCDTQQGCCVPIPCTQAGECPTPCPQPSAYAPASMFFPMQCNYCQFGFCVDPPPPPPSCTCTAGTLCPAECTGNNNPICNTGVPNCQTATCCTGCTTNGQCDDGNVCTTDTCNVNSGACNHAAVDCSDGNACNGVETCNPQSGCVAGTPVVCDDSNACTDDLCNPQNGNCQFQNNQNPCDDGIFCNGVDNCQAGQCNSGNFNPCDDSNECTLNNCDEDTETCSNPSISCNACEACNPQNGQCQVIQGCCVTDQDCNQQQCEKCIGNSCVDCSGGSDGDGDGFTAGSC